jgi:hypothetical protein
MSPIVACTAADHPAVSLVVEKSQGRTLSAKLLMLEVHSWWNAPMLARIEELLSSFVTGFSSQTSEGQEEWAVSLDLSVHLSSFTLCFFAPDAAIALQVSSGLTNDDLFSEFFKERGPRWNKAACPPFIEVQRRLDETTCRLYADRAQIHNLTVEGGLIEIVDGGYADAFSIACVFNAPLNLQSLSQNLPDNIAALIDRSKLLPFVEEETGIGKTMSIARTALEALEITIDGDIQLQVSPISLRSVADIASSFSTYSRPRDSSGAFKVRITGLNIQFLGPLFLKLGDIQLLHIIDDSNSAFTIGSIGSVHLHGGFEWPYISTLDNETMAIAFGVSDLTSGAVKKQLILHTAGITLAEDFLRERPVWSEFDYIKSIAMQSPGDATPQSLAVHVSGKELLILQVPSSEFLPIAAAVNVQSFSIASGGPGDIIADIDGISIYLKENGLAYTGFQPPFSVPTWLQRKEFHLIAREEQLHFKRSVVLLQPESISLRTRSLNINISKESAALLKRLAELPPRRRLTAEAYENVAEMQSSDAMEQALGLTLETGSLNQHALDGKMPLNFLALVIIYFFR